MNKVLRAAIRTMSRHQGDMTKDYEKSRKKEKMYPYYKGRSCNTMDRILHLEGRDILLRTYSYDGKVAPLILFFHGGGFVTGDFESYTLLHRIKYFFTFVVIISRSLYITHPSLVALKIFVHPHSAEHGHFPR